MSLRRLGNSDLMVSSIGFGCWPMAGITSIVDSTRDVVDAIRAALDVGINFFDTAYSYGYAGESDALLKQALAGRREQAIIASKAGSHWGPQRERVLDARPETLVRHAEEVLSRLGTDYLDLFYLHTPDGNTPIAESAEGVAEVVRRGLSRYAAVSNVSCEQAREFHAICPVIAIQPYFNMLQQSAVEELRGFCQQENIAIVCYWVLMKGLLAGRLGRHHQFDPRDRRLNYDIFKGESWQRNQDLVDQLHAIADRLTCTVSQLVIAWTLAQPQITVALCGAKRPEQILENAGGMRLALDSSTLAEIDACIALRGQLP